MADSLTVAAGVLLIVGGIFALAGAIGMLRFPDVYTRMHAASKAGLVGSGLALLAVAFSAAEIGVSIRALLAMVFFMLTTPLAAHLVARASIAAGYRPHGAGGDSDHPGDDSSTIQ